jgi:hypothetical protein
MKKVTKAALIKCAKEVNKVWKMDPLLLEKGTVEELESNQIAEILPDMRWEAGVDDKGEAYKADKFTPATTTVIEYLKAKAAPVEVEETTKEKKAREKAEKKAAKEAEEAPEETAKEKKAREKAEKKAAKEEEAEEPTLAAQVKGEMKKQTLIDFVENEGDFKKHKKALLGMKNHLAMRKQMSIILAGEKPNFEEAPKEKKEKKVNPLVAEVEACEKKKELKGLCKENKVFSGIKVKKFDNVEDLKAEMQKALVPVKKEKKEKKEKKKSSSHVVRKMTLENVNVTKEEILEKLEAEGFKDVAVSSVQNRMTEMRHAVKILTDLGKLK